MTLKELPSIAKRVAFLREKLSSDDRWAARAVLKIHSYQTESEQRQAATEQHNGVGFSGIDAAILTNYVDRLIQRGGATAAYDKTKPFVLDLYLTPKQTAELKRRIVKYAGQLERITRS